MLDIHTTQVRPEQVEIAIKVSVFFLRALRIMDKADMPPCYVDATFPANKTLRTESPCGRSHVELLHLVCENSLLYLFIRIFGTR